MTKPKTGFQELANPILERLEEAKAEKEIVAYKGPPGMPTAHKTRDKHRVRLICYLKAIGMRNKDIASSVGCSPAEVGRILKSESAQAEIERIQHEIFVSQPAKMFESILPQAVRIAVNAMMSRKTKASVRVDAAFKFMDRALGKPTQTVEHNTNLVRELITKISQSEESTALDADFFVVQTEGADNKDKKDNS